MLTRHNRNMSKLTFISKRCGFRIEEIKKEKKKRSETGVKAFLICACFFSAQSLDFGSAAFHQGLQCLPIYPFRGFQCTKG